MSVAHNFGIWVPPTAAAYMTELPSGTLTGLPSISSDTFVVVFRRGVPKSISVMACIFVSSSKLRSTLRSGVTCLRVVYVLQRRTQFFHISDAKIFGKVLHRANDRVWDQPAKSAKRTVQHEVGQISQ